MSLCDATDEIPEFTLAGKRFPAKVVSCYDGDTFHAVIPFREHEFLKFQCRMLGYDSPEMKPLKSAADRDVEKAQALRAKHALLSQLCDGMPAMTGTLTDKELNACLKSNKKVITLECGEFDKYGRVLVKVINTDGSSVNDWMIGAGHGVKYDGRKRV